MAEKLVDVNVAPRNESEGITTMAREKDVFIDRMAHRLMKFNPLNATGRTVIDGYLAFYHEEQLYSVRNIEKGIVSLVYASSPKQAIELVRAQSTTVYQNGDNCTCIHNVGTLNL